MAVRFARPDGRGVCVCLFHGVYEGVGPHVVHLKKRRGKTPLLMWLIELVHGLIMRRTMQMMRRQLR